MGENSTTISNAITNKAMVRENDIECTDADALLFFHALRAELDRLQKRPKPTTIDNILAYSKSQR